jgi:hypothetical protein
VSKTISVHLRIRGLLSIQRTKRSGMDPFVAGTGTCPHCGEACRFLKSCLPMSRTRATSLLRSGLSSSIQLRLTTPKVRSRHISQNVRPWRAGEVYGLRTEELIQPDFYRIRWVAPKRTLFYVPGSSQKMIDKAWSLEVDNIVSLPSTVIQLNLTSRPSTWKIRCTPRKRPKLAI